MKKTSLIVLAILLCGVAFMLTSCKKNYYGVQIRESFINGKYTPELEEIIPESMLKINGKSNSNAANNVFSNSLESSNLESIDFEDLKSSSSSDFLEGFLESIERNREEVERKKEEVLYGMFMRVNFQNWDDEPIYGLKVQEEDVWVKADYNYYKHEKTDEFERLYSIGDASNSMVTIYGNNSYEICDIYEEEADPSKNFPGKPEHEGYYNNYYSYNSDNLFIFYSVEISGWINRMSYVRFEEVDGYKTGVIANFINEGVYEDSGTVTLFRGNEEESYSYTKQSFSNTTDCRYSSHQIKDGLAKTYEKFYNQEFLYFDLRYLDNIDKIQFETQTDDHGYPTNPLFIDILTKDGISTSGGLAINISHEYESKNVQRDILNEEGEVITTIDWVELIPTGSYTGMIGFWLDIENRFDFDLNDMTDLDDLFVEHDLPRRNIDLNVSHSDFLDDYKLLANNCQTTMDAFRIDLSDELKEIDVVFSNYDELILAFEKFTMNLLVDLDEVLNSLK
ncbi:hypothetical protein LJC17_03895 [Acholeplasma sp. OttesenSCG-928-E16]|nr:hypothetical protein [Acholeplasma sp. OttesenSCG-928-E16]